MSEPARILTRHVLKRYRSRINSHATEPEIQRTVDAATIGPRPAWKTPSNDEDRNVDVWLIDGTLAFPCRRAENGDLHVMTVISKRARTKRERRLLREAAREDALT